MCGRFVSSTTSDEIAKFVDVDTVGESRLEPVPTDTIVGHHVRAEVNNVRNQGEHLTDAIEAPAPDDPASDDARNS